jgi:hypothetical protein
MRKLFLLAILCAFYVRPASADDKIYGPVNVSATSVSGDQVRGPITVRLVGINVIHWNVQVGVNVTYPSGPDLTLPFIPKLTGTGAQTTTPPPTTPTDASRSATTNTAPNQMLAPHTLLQPQDVGGVFTYLVNKLNQYEGDRLDLQGNIQTGIATVSDANTKVAAFASSSDLALATQPEGATLLPQIAPLLSGYVAPALSYHWPNANVATLETNLVVLKNNLVVLQDNPGWSDWIKTVTNKNAYDAVVSRVNDLVTSASTLEATSNKSAAALTDSQTKLQQWNAILTSALSGGAASFTRTVPASCSFGFSNNKNIQVEMATTDRLAAPGAAASKLQIVTVICSTPFSISGGFGFSSVKEQTVSFLQSQNSSGQVISVFGYKAKSSFRPLPLLMLNTRFHEWNDDWAVHFSNGAVVDIKTGAAGGTDVEFVSGISLSFRRSLFITGGFHAGRIQKLAGGFAIGQQVPASVSSPPTESRWTPGAVIAFTYKFK